MPNYSNGGWNDFVSTDDNLEKLISIAKQETNIYGKSCDIIDGEIQEVILNFFIQDGEIRMRDNSVMNSW